MLFVLFLRSKSTVELAHPPMCQGTVGVSFVTKCPQLCHHLLEDTAIVDWRTPGSSKPRGPPRPVFRPRRQHVHSALLIRVHVCFIFVLNTTSKQTIKTQKTDVQTTNAFSSTMIGATAVPKENSETRHTTHDSPCGRTSFWNITSTEAQTTVHEV